MEMRPEFDLEIQNLTFSYPDGHQALKGITLRVQRGEKIALVGPNGAGKSTLLLHLNGILQGEGEVKVCGTIVSRPNLAQVRAKVGMVFQNPDDQLFSPTVFDDVAFGPIYQGLKPNQINERVMEALEAVHMKEYIQRVSHHLSAGEKKRIAIATVLSMQPQILVLDEPSAGLDPRSRWNLIELLRELTQTMVIATHDLALVGELIPRMVVMDDGAIAADGLTEELLKDIPLLAAHGLNKDFG
jgi:cobalt/nickel transport system ATP-binding protein